MTTSMAIALTPLAFLVASYLMVATATAKKRLRWKADLCPVCHRDRSSCTCRWL